MRLGRAAQQMGTSKILVGQRSMEQNISIDRKLFFSQKKFLLDVTYMCYGDVSGMLQYHCWGVTGILYGFYSA